MNQLLAIAHEVLSSHQMIYHQGVQYRPEHIIQKKMVDQKQNLNLILNKAVITVYH
jgi:hypothetical protein